MTEVRREIDRLDRAIVVLLAERFGYIAQAAGIKQQRDQIRDEARIEDVIAKVSALAAHIDAPAERVAAVFRELVEQSIAHEAALFEARMGKAGPAAETE
ncbi:MAG: chorismate mutase [Sphingomonadales bacterium]